MSDKAVLLIAFGGPEKMEDVRPFLANLLRGRPVPPERVEEVARHYELFGGRSPLNEITFRQARALQELLQQDGLRLPVYVGMRNWSPYLHETLVQMARDGVSHALGFILSAQQSYAGWNRYQEDVAAARQKLGQKAPLVDYTPGWHDHPLFIEAMAELVSAALAEVPHARRAHTPLVFTAHSLPVAMPGTSTYTAQVTRSASLVAEKVRHARWSVAYQSRSGDPPLRPFDSAQGRLGSGQGTPWLEPDISQVIPQLAVTGAKELVVVPIGFVCDHIEVIYDLDIEARQLAEAHGLRQIRAATVNDHPTFIRMMADMVRGTLKTYRW
jgi:ferrochelatase